MFPLEIWHLVLKQLPLRSYFWSVKLLVPPRRLMYELLSPEQVQLIRTLFSLTDPILIIWWILHLDLTEDIKFHIYSAVRVTAQRGDRALLNWLIVHHKDVAAKMSRLILKTAAQHGQSHLVDWLFPLCCSRSIMVEATCKGACKGGNLLILAKARPHMRLSIAVATFGTAVCHGKLTVLCWLRKHFHICESYLESVGPRHYLSLLLGAAAAGGHLDVLYWLTLTFRITARKANKGGCQLLRQPILNGNLKVVQWWLRTFPFEDKLDTLVLLRSWAQQGGHQAVIDWLKQQ